jgi:phosphoglycolate phosphatase-like HAD superfamily hydrolase
MQQPSPHTAASDPRAIDRDRTGPAFLFDLDGTLVDSVYQHVLAWREALEAAGIELAVWRIHRRIGMSGGLLANALLRETGCPLSAEQTAHLQRLHAEAYAQQARQVHPLPGARELLAYLSKVGVPWAIATSGRIDTARPVLASLAFAFTSAQRRMGMPYRNAGTILKTIENLGRNAMIWSHERITLGLVFLVKKGETAMSEFLSRFNAGELIALVSVVGGLLCAITAILAGTWQKVRRAEITAALKQDMLSRGLSADDIRTVLEAGSRGSRKALNQSA